MKTPLVISGILAAILAARCGTTTSANGSGHGGNTAMVAGLRALKENGCKSVPLWDSRLLFPQRLGQGLSVGAGTLDWKEGSCEARLSVGRQTQSGAIPVDRFLFACSWSERRLARDALIAWTSLLDSGLAKRVETAEDRDELYESITLPSQEGRCLVEAKLIEADGAWQSVVIVTAGDAIYVSEKLGASIRPGHW